MHSTTHFSTLEGVAQRQSIKTILKIQQNLQESTRATVLLFNNVTGWGDYLGLPRNL